MPGVQNPHCRPCSCIKPSCTGCNCPLCASPSTVSTSPPSACTASTVHDFTDLPLRSTVQAPQWLVSQPMCLPVWRSRSRKVWMSSSRGSPSVSTLSPLSVNAMRVLAILISLRPCQCLTNRSARHLAGHVGLVLAVAAQILGGVADRHRLLRGLLDQRLVDHLAGEQRRRFAGLERSGCDVGKRDVDLFANLAVELQLHRGGGGGEVAGLAFELAIGGTAAFGHRRYANLGEEFVGRKFGVIEAVEEMLRGYQPFAARTLQHEGRVDGDHHRRVIVARIAVSDVAAEGAAIAHLRVGYLFGGFGQQRTFLLEQVRGDQLVLGGQRNNKKSTALFAYTLELLYAIEIDEVFGMGEAQFHHR